MSPCDAITADHLMDGLEELIDPFRGYNVDRSLIQGFSWGVSRDTNVLRRDAVDRRR